MENYERHLKIAVKAAKNSEKIFKQYYGQPTQIRKKNQNYRDLVTKADRQIELLIKKQISRAFPEHEILGEEFGWLNHRQTGRPAWIIDPIDGTTNFIQGLPLCCTSIALWDQHGPAVAVLNNPIEKKLFTAIRGRGTFLNGRRTHVSQASSIKNSFGGVGWGRNVELGAKLLPHFVRTARKVRVLGSAAWEMSKVAEGSYDYFIQGSIHVWDIAAGVLLIEEAGGRITGWDNKPLDISCTNIIGSNSRIHKEIFSHLKKLA